MLCDQEKIFLPSLGFALTALLGKLVLRTKRELPEFAFEVDGELATNSCFSSSTENKYNSFKKMTLQIKKNGIIKFTYNTFFSSSVVL